MTYVLHAKAVLQAYTQTALLTGRLLHWIMQHYCAGLVQQQGSKVPLLTCCEELACSQPRISSIEGDPWGPDNISC